VPEPLLATVDGGSLESMTLPLAAGPGGDLAGAAVAQVERAAAGKQAVALGPGLGESDATAGAVRELVERLGDVPLVLDADGLNAFAGRLAELAGRRAPAVLTPHPGEMARLLGTTSAEVQADRVAAARRAARASGAVVILKGHQTLVAEPEGGVSVNPTGNPGMASGGSGDVLTGLVAALLAQGYEAPVAAELGVFLHGLAGDLALVDGAPEALAAGDLIDALPRAFAALRSA
jgi:NAD(P)H-hydrate epimerase